MVIGAETVPIAATPPTSKALPIDPAIASAVVCATQSSIICCFCCGVSAAFTCELSTSIPIAVPA